MIDLGFSASSKQFNNVVVFSVMSAMLDVEFSLDRIFQKLDHTVMMCHWPSEKIMQEIRRRAAIIYIDMKRGERASEIFVLQPFFFHVVVNMEEECVRIYVPKKQADAFDYTSAEDPVFAFCYR